MKRYQALAALLRGEQPRNLLPPTPRGYVASRLRELADGPVVRAFRWNGGGGWGGKPWSTELPTDAALMLFLFAAFLGVCTTSSLTRISIAGGCRFLQSSLQYVFRRESFT